MSWIFSKSVMQANSANTRNMTEQYSTLNMMREMAANADDRLAAEVGRYDRNLAANMGRIPQDVYRDMDAQAVAIMRQPNLTLLTDLLPLAKSLSIGKILAEYRQSSDAGNVVTSLSGQVPVMTDKTAYKYDGNIVPVHAVAYGREFRELEGQRSEGFDGLIDDSANATRNLLNRMANYVYNGDETVSFKGKVGYGVKNSPNTALVDLGAGGLNVNLTAGATTGIAIYNAFKSLRDRLRITNAVNGMVTFYVSRTILSNMERPFDTGNSSNISILEYVRKLEGVAAVKEDASLTGNEAIFGVVSAEYIRPLVGMATGTYQVPRTMFNSNYDFVTANAVGLEIRADYEGKSGWGYARNA
jgi:hypothetical protein